MALYDSENNRLLDVNGNVLLARNVSYIGTNEIKKIYVGENEVQKIYIGTTLVYEKPIVIPQLQAPVISLSGDTLSIEEVENAEYYDIYVDGVLEESIDVRPQFNVSIVITSESDPYNAKKLFKVYDGQDNTGIVLINSTSATTQTPMNVICRSGYLFIELISGADFGDYTEPTSTTGITLDTTNFDNNYPTYVENVGYVNSLVATISADGTITFPYIKWED